MCIRDRVRGIQKMIDDGKDCGSVINQVSAARKALDKVGFLILTNKMQDCIRDSDAINQSNEKVFDDALKLFLTLS